jgi:SOS-response transcriptional repressor LexA
MILIDNFVAARKKAGLSQKELGRRVGLTQQAIGEIERGVAKQTVKITAIARVLGVPVEHLDPVIPSAGPDAPPLAVPIVTWVSAGRPTENDGQDIIGEIRVSDLNPRGEWLALRVEGDSMDRISPPGSVILVNAKDTKLINNGCYVIDVGDGETTYKRYRSDPQRFEPVSVNQEGHQTLYFNNPPRIIGRVRRSILEM